MSTPSRTARVVAAAALLAVAAATAWALWFTPAGQAVRADPRHAADWARRYVDGRPVIAPVAFLAVYVTLAVLCLPIWWLQILSGVAFGPWAGGGLCLAGSAVGATVTAALADWFAGRWFHDQVEPHVARLRRLDEVLGSNALLTVLTVRLTHVVPFGVGNVALGLTRVSAAAVFVGTLVGNVPAVAVYVGIGAGFRPREHWPFAAAIVGLNVVLLVPLFVRLWQARRARSPVD